MKVIFALVLSTVITASFAQHPGKVVPKSTSTPKKQELPTRDFQKKEIDSDVAENTPGYLSLSGLIPDLAGKKPELKQLDHYKANFKPDASGKFNTGLILKPGYYLLTDIDKTIYLEPGMDLNIVQKGDDLIFKGKGGDENTAIQQVNKLLSSSFPRRYNDLTDDINMVEPADFMTRIDKFEKAAKAIIAQTQASKFFKKSQAEDIKYMAQLLKIQYLAHYGIDPKIKNQVSQLEFEWLKNQRMGTPDTALTNRYKKAKIAMHVKKMSAADSAQFNVLADLNLNNTFGYKHSANYHTLFTQRMVDLSNAMWAKDNSVQGKAFADKLLSTYITDTTLRKEEDFQYVMSRFKIKRNTDEAYKEYSQSGADKNYIADIWRLYAGKKGLTGLVAPEFAYADKDGAKVTSADMKGNYLFIDFWATYCLPCIGQIPAIKNLEKKYEGRNIKFVSVTVDADKDQDKWKKFIADNQMNGLQLTASGADTKFTDFFKVNGIPRFIIIDPEGKVVTEDALRPDEPDLQKQIDALLTKN